MNLSPDLQVLAAAFAGFAVFLASHILVFHYANPKNSSLVFLSSFILGALSNGAFVFLPAAGPKGLILFTSGFIYVLLVFHYLAWIFGMGEAAIRIRLIIELDRMPERTASLAEIYARYNADLILKTRLERLVNAGHLHFDGRHYRIRSKILILQSKVSGILKSLLGMSR